MGLVPGQDGGVEGPELTFPLVKTPKSQLMAEQPSTKKTGTYQKRYSTSKEETTTRQ